MASVRDDKDQVLNALLPFAEQMLRRHGSFHPFAAALTRGGEVELVLLVTEAAEDHPESAALPASFQEVLRERAVRREIRACGVCADMRVTKPQTGEVTEAIGAFIEHVEDQPVEVYLPYSRKRLRGYSFRESWESPGEPRVFVEHR